MNFSFPLVKNTNAKQSLRIGYNPLADIPLPHKSARFYRIVPNWVQDKSFLTTPWISPWYEPYGSYLAQFQIQKLN